MKPSAAMRSLGVRDPRELDDAYDWAARRHHTSVPLGLWGEWEGPSVF